MKDRPFPETVDSLWIDAHLATLAGSSYGIIEDGARAVDDGRIAWVGPAAALPDDAATRARSLQQLAHAWLTCGKTIVTGGAERDRYVEIHRLGE